MPPTKLSRALEELHSSYQLNRTLARPFADKHAIRNTCVPPHCESGSDDRAAQLRIEVKLVFGVWCQMKEQFCAVVT